jgi:hypothetical protein
LPLIDRIAILCAGEASRTIFKCRSHALAVSSEISKLVEVLADDHRLEIINAGYRRAIEIIKSNAPEVEQLAGRLIRQRRVREAQLDEVERQTTTTQVRQAQKVPAANVVRFSVPPISWRGRLTLAITFGFDISPDRRQIHAMSVLTPKRTSRAPSVMSAKP